MGRSSRWLLGLIGVKKNSKSSKDGSSPSPSRKEEEKKPPKEKRRWSFGRAFTSTSKAEPQTPRSSAGNKIHEDNQHAVAVAAASAVAAEAAVAAAHAAAAVVRLTGGGILYGGTRLEELAAIKIQTAFRGYLAKRALRALKAVVRIQALFRGHTVRKQAAITLRCMQALVRVQARVRARRVRMSEEGRAVQQQILRRRLEQQARPRKSVEGWNASSGTVEELQAKEERRQAAALKRERALAYAFSHQCQQKSGSNENSFSGNIDIDTPQWGWSWLERWMAARPWESPQVEDSKPGLECGSLERNSEGSARFLEMDLKKSRRTNRRSNLSSESLSAEANTFTSSSTAINTWPSSPGRSLQPVDSYSVPQIPTPVRSSRQSAVYTIDRHFNSSDTRTNSNGLNGEFTAEDDDSFLSTAKSSPAFSTAGSRMTAKHNPFDSARSEMADEFFYGHSAFPNYMAATQSAKAKKRSHSAPKQRPRTPERTPLSSRKRNSLSVSLSAMEVKSNSGRSRLQKQNSHVWPNRGIPGTYLIDRSSLRDSQSVISVNDDAHRHFRF